MTGYVLVTGQCGVCPAVITFNPQYVPSIRIKGEGEKQPLCWGLTPIPLHPQAYEPEECL